MTPALSEIICRRRRHFFGRRRGISPRLARHIALLTITRPFFFRRYWSLLFPASTSSPPGRAGRVPLGRWPWPYRAADRVPPNLCDTADSWPQRAGEGTGDIDAAAARRAAGGRGARSPGPFSNFRRLACRPRAGPGAPRRLAPRHQGLIERGRPPRPAQFRGPDPLIAATAATAFRAPIPAAGPRIRHEEEKETLGFRARSSPFRTRERADADHIVRSNLHFPNLSISVSSLVLGPCLKAFCMKKREGGGPDHRSTNVRNWGSERVLGPDFSGLAGVCNHLRKLGARGDRGTACHRPHRSLWSPTAPVHQHRVPIPLPLLVQFLDAVGTEVWSREPLTGERGKERGEGMSAAGEKKSQTLAVNCSGPDLHSDGTAPRQPSARLARC